MTKKILLTALTLIVLGAGAAVVLAQGPRDGARGGTPPPMSASERADVSGPCDEPEHARDPRCGDEARTGEGGPGGPGRFQGCDDRYDDDSRDRDDRWDDRDDRWDDQYDRDDRYEDRWEDRHDRDDRWDDDPWEDRDDWDDRWDRD